MSKSSGTRTQGAKRGKIYNAVANWRSLRSRGSVSRDKYVKECYQSRALERKAKSRQSSCAAPREQSNVSAPVKVLCSQLIQLDTQGRITNDWADHLIEHVNNGWRTGTFVHGRRYMKDSSHLAMSQVLYLKGTDFVRRAMNENKVALLPHLRTLHRRTKRSIQFDFGIQPVSTFDTGSSILPHTRVHCCNDEVAVNGKVARTPCDEGQQITGLADRCARERSPVGVKYIITDKGQILVQKSTDETGKHDLLPLEDLGKIAELPRATQLCVFLLFCAEHGSPAVFAGAVPTIGDLTMTDDGVFLHQIITRAKEAGLSVSFYGADNASPHALLSRGIVRALSSIELKALTAEYMRTKKRSEKHYKTQT
jgi:hypothetical protein